MIDELPPFPFASMAATVVPLMPPLPTVTVIRSLVDMVNDPCSNPPPPPPPPILNPPAPPPPTIK